MGGCAVPGCNSRTEKKENSLRLFCVPSLRTNVPLYSQQRLQRRCSLWLTKIGRMDLMHENTELCVCNRHFLSGKPAALSDETNPDWAPALHLGENDVQEQPEGEAAHEALERDPPVGPHLEDAHVATHPSTEDEVINAYENVFPSDPIMYILRAPMDAEVTDGVMHCDSDVSVSSVWANNSYVSEFSVYQDIVNSTVLNDCFSSEQHKLKDKHNRLLAEHNDLKLSYTRLGNELSEASVDNLELSNSKTSLHKELEDYSIKCVALKAESETLKVKAEQSEALANQYKEQAKIAEDKIRDLEMRLAKAEKCAFTQELLQNSDKLKHFTDLTNYRVFDAVLTLVTRAFSDRTNSLQPWQCLLLTLMRLKMGLQLEDLAHRFDVSKSTVSYVFEKWLYYLYVCLEPCIHWPDRETQYKTMPNSFKEIFGKSIAVIIDCLELFCERPTSLNTRAMMWSNYKHHHTVKFLTETRRSNTWIGITPLGAISFISQGCGGRVSDKHITANSGLYEKLLPNDAILADRGFTIGEDLGLYCAKLSIPAFTKGQAQLSAHDITDTRKLASLRVQVERVIGLVKNKYRLLQTTLNRDMLVVKPGYTVAQIDEIVRVSCALTNFSPVIV